MKDILRPILELSVVLPGLLLAYFPVKSYLKQSPGKLAARILPLMAGLCIGGGIACYQLHASTASALAGITLLAIGLYTGTLKISLWKSGTIALTVCAVFACINSLSRAISVAIALHMQLPQDEPWFCLAACVFYNIVCWILALTAFYPSTHAVRVMVEDDNFAQTWYVFWVLPLVFIFLNLFMIPRYQTTLRTGRVLQGYIVISIALLLLLLWFNAIFLLMATSLNRNARLQQENQLLFMQQQRYEKKTFPVSQISVYTSAKTVQQIASSAIIVPWQSAKTFPFAQSSICRRFFRSMRSTCVWSCPTCWKMRLKPVSVLRKTGGRSKLLHICMPSGCF